MKGKLYKQSKKGWFIKLNSKYSITKIKVIKKQEEQLFDFNNKTEVEFELKLFNPMGREIDPLDLTKNTSMCEWMAEIKDLKNPLEHNESNLISNKELIKSGALWASDKIWKILKREGIETKTLMIITNELRETIIDKFK